MKKGLIAALIAANLLMLVLLRTFCVLCPHGYGRLRGENGFLVAVSSDFGDRDSSAYGAFLFDSLSALQGEVYHDV